MAEPTNAPGKAKKHSISLPDIKVFMLFQATDVNKVKTVFITIFMDIQSSSFFSFFFFIKKSCGAPEFHLDSHLVR